jgi:hypothetical protein
MPIDFSRSNIKDTKLSNDGLSIDGVVSISKQELLDELQLNTDRLSDEQLRLDVITSSIASIQAI